jgi:hypothetical protein
MHCFHTKNKQHTYIATEHPRSQFLREEQEHHGENRFACSLLIPLVVLVPRTGKAPFVKHLLLFYCKILPLQIIHHKYSCMQSAATNSIQLK